MSGGIAYVLDGDGDFEKRCNMAMVELEPIANEDRAIKKMEHQDADPEAYGLVDIMHDMTSQDAQRLRVLIHNHLKYTGSSRAREILDDWDNVLPRFVKVMPVDYRRALQEMQGKKKTSEQDDISLAVGS